MCFYNYDTLLPTPSPLNAPSCSCVVPRFSRSFSRQGKFYPRQLRCRWRPGISYITTNPAAETRGEANYVNYADILLILLICPWDGSARDNCARLRLLECVHLPKILPLMMMMDTREQLLNRPPLTIVRRKGSEFLIANCTVAICSSRRRRIFLHWQGLPFRALALFAHCLSLD